MKITFRRLRRRVPVPWFKTNKKSYEPWTGNLNYTKVLTDQPENVTLTLVWLGIAVECKHNVR